MSIHSNYYKLIRERLELSEKDTGYNKSISETSSTTSDTTQQEIKSINSNEITKINNEKNKNTKNQLTEWQMFAMKSYFSKCNSLKPRTRKDFIKIIKDFIQFSPEINPEDLEPFIAFKIKIQNQNSEFKYPYSKTQGKYASVIKRFLENIYTIDPLGIKIEYYKRRSKTERNKPPKLSNSDLFRAYEELVKNVQFQDALILNIMYSLAIDPYILYMLTYEGINSDGEISYWDYKQKAFVTKKLHNELKSDINFFKAYSLSLKINSNDFIRTSEDEETIEGTFIFNISPTNMYNRFKRKFSNKLKWFDYTPKNIIELSNYRKKFDKSDFCLNKSLKLG